MTKSAFYNICNKYCEYLEDDSETGKKVLSLVSKILNILGITYNESKELFTYKQNNYTVEANKFLLPSISSKSWNKYKKTFNITSISISYFDIECIEDMINKTEYSSYAAKTLPIFSSMGWILNDCSGIYKLTNLEEQKKFLTKYWK